MGWLKDKWDSAKQKVSNITEKIGNAIDDGISFVKEHGHDILDVAGFVPALGAIPDAINGLWYMAEGDWENMGWSFVSAIPELGDGLGLANKSRKVVKGLDLLDKGTDAVKIAKKADNVSDALELAKKAGKMETGAEMVKNFFKKGKQKLKEFWEKITRKNKKNCGSGRGTCFPSDTPILTREGYVPIQNIRAGDDIYSREETTGETGFQKVEEVFLRSVHTIYTIEVNTITKIQTTSRHPFYVEGEGWVIANQLQVGMNLQTFNGTAVITNLKKERTDEVIPVYNFRVSGWSSYFVSEWNVYVHNANEIEYTSSKKKDKPKIEGKAETQYSGELKKVEKEDAAADALAERIGGESRVRFSNDPDGREFDVVSDDYIAQAKPDLRSYGKSWRRQTKATFEAAKATGRKAYFQFEGTPADDILRKIAEYGERYGVDYVIDTTPVGVHN